MSEMSLEASVEARLTNLRAEAPPVTIFRVPPFTRKGNPATYEPHMVSIGPYYHGADGLRTMEDHKWRYLRDLLSRSVHGVSSSSLIQEMRSLETQARSCYSEQSLLSSDNFVQMLLLDGCFILEFFFKRHDKQLDVLCEVGGGLTLLTSDLLLLENQIPFFAIKKLYDTLAGTQGGPAESLHNLVLGVQGRPAESLLDLFLKHISDKEPIVRPAATDEIQHLLHLYYISYVPRRSPALLRASSGSPDASSGSPGSSGLPASAGSPDPSSGSPDPWMGNMPPATELCEADVTLVLRRSARDMFDVSFDGDRGVMEIPAIDVEGPLLVNLMAFEQTQREEDRVLSGYMSLMGMLVRTPQDVELLYRRGILVKLLFTDVEETARFFRHLGSAGTTNYNRQFWADLCEDVQRYCYSWMQRNRPLEDSMLARLLNVQGQQHAQVAPQEFTIFRVPSCFHERNRTAYEPSMISIGPYFHGAASLRTMEDQKWLHLHSLLRRNPEVQLSALIKEMQSLEPKARACYSEPPALGSNDFVRMLLLDSSLILEYFIEGTGLFDIGWVRSAIWIDLFFLLENQIPLFVLERLYSIIIGPVQVSSWESFITEVAGWLSNGREPDTRTTDIEIKHLLHLCYINSVPAPLPECQEPAACSMTMYIGELLQRCHKSTVQERELEYALPRATEMHEAGVTFKLRTSARDMYDVTFDGAKGIMEIPKLELEDNSWPTLANLLAFEQTQLDRKTWVLKSYVKLMSLMLRTAKDVELLRTRRIVVNHLADDEAAAQFFSHLGDGFVFSPEMPNYNNLYRDVHRYCDSWRHKSRAVLMRDYLGTPWKIISILVAAILLTLTAIQTYFTVFPR